MKIAVVGGGSTYTPELVDGIARLRAVLDVDELTLIDPAAERLDRIGRLGQRMFSREGHPGVVSWTSDLAAGVEGASFVLIQLRVGGQEARLSDELFPLACDCVGQETTGAGGLAKALRTVPLVLEVAETVRRHAPDAWIVDFTNPVGIVTRALLQEGHRAVGLCNVAIGFQRFAASMLDVAPHRISLDHVGLNHLSWERAVRLDGEDVLPSLLAERGEELSAHVGLPLPLMRMLRAVPSYYLRYYYAHDPMLARMRTEPPRAEVVARVERELLEAYADPALDVKPPQLAERGGAFYSEAAVDLIASLHAGLGDVQVANVRNDGRFSALPDDAVVEVPARVTADGPVHVPGDDLDPELAGLVAHVTAYEDLALQAALHGGRDRVVSALLAHPLVGQWHLAEDLADRLIDAGRAHLAWAR